MNKSKVWKPVIGYEGLYEVSNFGEIKSLARFDSLGRPVKERLLKQVRSGRDYRKDNCYMYVGLNKNGIHKSVSVHRIVAQAFLGEPQKGYEVNHKDEDKTNNCLDNLEYVTRRENLTYRGRAKRIGKLYEKPVRGRKILTNEIVEFSSAGEAAIALGKTISSRSAIRHAINDSKSHQAFGYVWEYI